MPRQRNHQDTQRSVHWRTPNLLVNDPRSLPVRQVAYLRTAPDTPAESRITQHHHDAAGRLTERWDPRLFSAAAKPNLASRYSLTGTPLRIDSVDAGWRLTLSGPAGEARQQWDARGQHWCSTYDEQLRIVSVATQALEPFETYTYADSSADAGHNLRGQMTTLQDPAGTLSLSSFSLIGQPRIQVRTFDDALHHRSEQTFGPLSQALTQTDAGGHCQLLHHDLAGQLKEVMLVLYGDTQPQIIYQDTQYNAAGQLIEQLGGNGMCSRWHYDPANGRLQSVQTTVAGQAAQQHLVYVYDAVGNVLSILDLTFERVYFANQLIDGERHFEYDSLYRLIRASGHDALPAPDMPGRPLPSDPNNLRNYVQHFEYDQGDNLTRLVHSRAVGGYTRQMLVDSTSNHALHWKEGDPPPDFGAFFDAHGNQRKLQHGADLLWNVQDQLHQVTLLKHDNGLADDREVYFYSQGERVCKRHETHSPGALHYLQVRYLPGLEIRTRDNGEELHVITLPGSVRCLHWRKKPPADVDNNQLRYSLDDHLGSSLIELDQHARLISRETYYPFGGTALWLPSSSAAVDYKTLRYSGKEMDVSGLYYYGARYYAPWLQRWTSADPAGDVDGLNLYAMVSNNPLRYFDSGGTEKTPSEARQQVSEFSSVLSQMNSELQKLDYQLSNLTRTRDIYKTAAKKLAFSVATFAVAIKAGAVGGAVGAGVGGLTGPAAPVVVPVASTIGAIFAAEASVKVMDKLGEHTGLGYSIMPDQAALSVKSLQSKAKASPNTIRGTLESFNPNGSAGLVKIGLETTVRVLGKHFNIPYLKQSLNIARQMAQLTEALNDAWGQGDLDRIGIRLEELTSYLDSQQASLQEHLETLAGAEPAPVKLIGIAQMPERADDDLAQLQQQMTVARGTIKHSRDLLGRLSAFLIQKHKAA